MSMFYKKREWKNLKKELSISILNAENVSEFLDKLKWAVIKYNAIKNDIFHICVHLDVMDQKFVPNKGVSLENIKLAKEYGFQTDTHLMVSEPILDRYIEEAIQKGTDGISIHYEIENFEETLRYLYQRKEKIKKEKKRDFCVGVAIKPDTPIEVLLPFKELFDKILIMTVEPGLGGQRYMQKVNEKIHYARALFDEHIIQVDGGISLETIDFPLSENVDSFVMGSYFMNVSKEQVYEKIISLSVKKAIYEADKEADVFFESRTLQVPAEKLLGIRVPEMRKIAHSWYRYVNFPILKYYLCSHLHDEKRFACFCLANQMKEKVKELEKGKETEIKKKEIEKIYQFVDKNKGNLNSWDLIDDVGPHTLFPYLHLLEEEKREKILLQYVHDKNMWIRRLGIVSLLFFARENEYALIFKILNETLYEEHHYIQKANGWVLRELYKVNPSIVLEYLEENHKKKKLPSILLSYAMEKMNPEEKKKVKGG